MLGSLANKIFGIGQRSRRLKTYAPEGRGDQRARSRGRGADRRGTRRPHDAVPRTSPRARRSTTCWSPAFATVREAAKRVLGQRHFDVQLIGGMVLHEGGIAEMRTGEGKTLVATLADLSQRAGRQGRPRRHRQRLPRPPRRRMDGPGLPFPRPERRRHRARPRRRPAQGGLRGRHHLRHQQRVRLRLPARQHEIRAGPDGPARARLRDRRRGRFDPGRRGAHAADHLGPVRRQLRALQQHRRAHPAASCKEDYDLDEKQRTVEPHRSRQRAHRGDARQRRGCSRKARSTRPPTRRSSTTSSRRCGAQAVPARQGLHRPQRRGRHHRRVHRPHDAGPPLFGRPAPGARGQGARGGPARERDAGLDHLPELLPALQEARRHDRHGLDRGRRVRRDLQARRRRDPDQPARVARTTRTTRSIAPAPRS